MGLTLLTPATVWPVTLDEARAHCRVVANNEDALLTGYIKAATRHPLDGFASAIELPRGGNKGTL